MAAPAAAIDTVINPVADQPPKRPPPPFDKLLLTVGRNAVDNKRCPPAARSRPISSAQHQDIVTSPHRPFGPARPPARPGFGAGVVEQVSVWYKQ